jgi:hypothetical protein
VIFSLISAAAFCQYDTVFIRHSMASIDKLSYKTDTVLFKSSFTAKHILYGTMVIPDDQNPLLWGYGLNLYSVSRSDCNNHGESTDSIAQDEILDIIGTDSALSIGTKVNANCCYSFLCTTKIENDSILDLIHIGYGEMCNCGCCFGLTYKFGMPPPSPDAPKKLKYVMINGDKKTIKPLKGR